MAVEIYRSTPTEITPLSGLAVSRVKEIIRLRLHDRNTIQYSNENRFMRVNHPNLYTFGEKFASLSSLAQEYFLGYQAYYSAARRTIGAKGTRMDDVSQDVISEYIIEAHCQNESIDSYLDTLVQFSQSDPDAIDLLTTATQYLSQEEAINFTFGFAECAAILNKNLK